MRNRDPNYCPPSCPCRCEGLQNSIDCVTLVRCFLDGDQDAGNALVDRFQPKLFETIRRKYRTACPHLLEDALQESWSSVFGDRASGHPELAYWLARDDRAPFFAWLITVVGHAVVDVIFRDRFHAKRVALDADIEASVPQCSDHRNEQLDLMRRCIAQLSPNDRQLYELAFVSGHKPEECAAKLGISARAYFVRKRSFLGRLERCLRRYREENPRA